jgi:multidrug efflux pump subunit AcrB
MLDHRKRLLVAVAALLVAVTGPLVKSLRTSFFPKDLSYFFYVDVWTPEDLPFR